MIQASAVSFRQNLGEMLNQVQYRHDSVVINKDGKPVAALVDARLFERIRRDEQLCCVGGIEKSFEVAQRAGQQIAA